MPRRAFNANPPAGTERCSATIVLRGQSVPAEQRETAQCMRRAVKNGLCRQHLRMASAGRN